MLVLNMAKTKELEKIVNRKTYKNEIYYKVKWTGSQKFTWLPASKCKHDKLVIEYERQRRRNGHDESEGDWEVEQILDKRISGNKVQYLVKWKDWPGGPTWELSDNCDCFNLIAAFENPKLKRLWDFTGSNRNLWLTRTRMLRYMADHLRRHKKRANLLEFERDFPQNERQLALEEGINIGPLCYENHWYLVIILVNHINVTRRILIGDALNTVSCKNIETHPVVRRLSQVYTHFPIKPLFMTPMDRSDVCAFYVLAAFERAFFVFDPKAKFVVNSLYFDPLRAELMRCKILPESDGEISVALPTPKGCVLAPQCEFCGKIYDFRQLVDQHILRRHFIVDSREGSISTNQ